MPVTQQVADQKAGNGIFYSTMINEDIVELLEPDSLHTAVIVRSGRTKYSGKWEQA